MRKNLPFYCGVALRCIALTFILSTMAAPARSETVLVEPAPATATVQSTGAWFFQDYLSIHFPSGIASLFNGYPTGQAACDVYSAWMNSLSGLNSHFNFFLSPGNTDHGICVPYNSFSEWLATNHNTFGMYYYQHCPTGYSTNDPRIRGVSSATFTCTNNGTAKQCPAVAAGETPFTLDTGGLTCSRPDKETYTLALTPETATVEPGKTFSFMATVTKQGGGSPSKPVPVSVKVEVDSTSGGHDGTHTSPRPKGSVSPSSGTNAFDIVFSSTAVSGTHEITAICDECTNSPQKSKVNVKVKEADASGWDSLSASPSDYQLVGGGESKSHHDNHYLTAEASDHLQAIYDTYNEVYPEGPVLYLNDASLVWGGKFDISGKWSGDHHEHLRGKEIDIRANQEPTAISFWRFADFKKIAGKNGASASVHCSFPKAYSWACWFDMGKNRHFHVRLTGK